MAQWPSGIGQTLGDSLVTGRPLVSSYTAYFVNSVGGDDTNNTGLDANNPFATLSKAVSAAATATVTPIIVLMSGHTETMTSTVTPSVGTIIVGGGASGGLPTVKLKMNASNTIMLTCSAAGVQVRNVWFQSNVQASNVARVKFTGINGFISGCYFECGQLDNAAGLEFGTGGSGGISQSCTFISTAALTTGKPTSGLLVSAALTDIAVLAGSFSDGVFGFTTNAFHTTATITRLRADFALLLGANASLGSATGYAMVTSTGSGALSYPGGG